MSLSVCGGTVRESGVESEQCFTLDSITDDWRSHLFTGFVNYKLFKLDWGQEMVLLLSILRNKSEFYSLRNSGGNITWTKTLTFEDKTLFTIFIINSTYLVVGALEVNGAEFYYCHMRDTDCTKTSSKKGNWKTLNMNPHPHMGKVLETALYNDQQYGKTILSMLEEF